MTDRQAVRSASLIKRGLVAFLFSVFCFQSFAAPPDSVQATYDVYKDFLKVEIKETYTRNQDRYTLTSVWLPTGLLAVLKPEKILVDSSGLVGRQGLQPLRYSHRREHDEDKNKFAEFDRQSKQLTTIHQGQRKTFPLLEDTQDRLSAMYQFMFLSLQDANTLDFTMTDGNKLDDYHYTITHNQTVKVPAGEFKAIYLDSQAKPGENRTEIWLATELHNLPCKIIVTEANGNKFTQLLSKLETKP